MVVSITSNKKLGDIKSLVKQYFVDGFETESTNEEITISTGYSKIYEDLQDSESYERELIDKLINEREDLGINEEKKQSIKNKTHVYDLINQLCNEHEVESEENRKCCDIVKAIELGEKDVERPIGFLKKDLGVYIYNQ